MSAAAVRRRRRTALLQRRLNFGTVLRYNRPITRSEGVNIAVLDHCDCEQLLTQIKTRLGKVAQLSEQALKLSISLVFSFCLLTTYCVPV